MTGRRFLHASFLIPILATLVFAQSPRETAVEIPVWVFDAGRFVDVLALDDFEVYEDGILQYPSSLRLIQDQAVVREEVRRPSFPSLHRHFYLLFQTADWDPKLGDAVDYLFQSLLLPGDTMTLVTPMKPYGLARDAVARKPKAALSREMQQILRKDIQRGGGDYRQTLRDLRRIVGAISGDRMNLESDMESDAAGTSFGLEMQLNRYKQGLRKLETMRLLDGKRLIEFAESLRDQPGRNFVFFFYQREFRPEISSSALAALMDMYQDVPNIRGDLQDLFQYYRQDQLLDAGLIRRAFADASITFSFIFMNKESQYMFGANMREQSEDIFPLFSGVAAATGGRAYTSQNPAASFQSAAEAAGRYYLLTYVPSRPAGDGGFRTIEVKVAGRDASLSCRAGYYAR